MNLKVNALRKRKSLLSRGAIYLFFAFLNRSMPFLLLPVYSRCLTTEDYGIYALFLTAVNIANPFLTLCWNNAIAYIYFNKYFDIRRYVSTFVLISVGLLAAQEGVLYLLSFAHLGRWAVPLFLLLTPLNALGLALISVVNAMWQVHERPLAFGLFQMFCAGGKAAMNLCVVFMLRLGWRGLLASETLFYLIATVVTLTILCRAGWLGWTFDTQHLKAGLKLGVGFLPGTLANLLNDSIGRILLADRFTVTDVGVYSMGQKLGTVTGLYTASLNNVYQPWFFKKLHQGGKGVGRRIFLSLIVASASILVFAGTAGIAMWLI
ncbi:MAG: oligosaccharide flippase family protein, partial [Synergistaceae bacterium]|nr:oligosaccharide flippase family protein [Synergistaceae bacterium]